MSRLLTITRAIAADPVAMLHDGAYRLTLGHARLRLQELAELDALAGKFEDRYGRSFALG